LNGIRCKKLVKCFFTKFEPADISLPFQEWKSRHE
jgi:hypothetical protein